MRTHTRGGTVLLFGTLLILLGMSSPPIAQAAEPAPLDAEQVRQKIAALAAPDETLPLAEQAKNWLAARRRQILPQLIAALDDANPKVVEECLELLHGETLSPALMEALLAKTHAPQTRIRLLALRQLERATSDPRVPPLLAEASNDSQQFPDPLVRARWAGLSGHKEHAVALLKPFLDPSDREHHNTFEAIRLLGEIGEPSSVALLEPIAAGDRWGMAVDAYQALAKIDPAGHGLTQAQAEFLQRYRGLKESEEAFRQRVQELAQLPAAEIRPWVLQMLRDQNWSVPPTALAILSIWKDRAALPEIRRLLQVRRSNYRRQEVQACLEIDDSPQAQTLVLELLPPAKQTGYQLPASLPDLELTPVLMGIAVAEIPTERKLSLLRAANSRLNVPGVLPEALRYAQYRQVDIHPLLVALMEAETRLLHLACYCRLASDDAEKRYAAPVRRAMRLLSDEPSVAAGGAKTTPEMAAAGATILAAVATYQLQEFVPDVQRLVGSQNATLRAAAQTAAAQLKIPGAMEYLYAKLRATEPADRHSAAQTLLSVAPPDEAERAAREKAVLACLGEPAEDYALRVLVGCGREASVRALLPILDDPDAQRAVHAAWVLAQLPDPQAARQGLRRVAILGMFFHQLYQAGSGIDFTIAPQLSFHQVLEAMFQQPGPHPGLNVQPVLIPQELLTTFPLDEAEQQYAVRCYRLAEDCGNPYGLAIHFLNQHRSMLPPPRSAPATEMDASYLPLLKEIVAHDSRLERLMVQGQAVAHFKYRQQAAQTLAKLTGGPASYAGLGGETLASDAFPAPYANQNQLVAQFVVARLEKAHLPAQHKNERQRRQAECWETSIRHLRDILGPEVVEAIRQEAQQRGLEVKNLLPQPSS